MALEFKAIISGWRLFNGKITGRLESNVEGLGRIGDLITTSLVDQIDDCAGLKIATTRNSTYLLR